VDARSTKRWPGSPTSGARQPRPRCRSNPSRGEVRDSLALEQLQHLRAKLALDEKARIQDLPELVDLMISTGLRIGEALSVRWSAVDFESGTLEVQATIVRVTGEGILPKEKPKSKAGWRVVELPAWTVSVLHAGSGTVPDNPWGVVFASVTGRLRDGRLARNVAQGVALPRPPIGKQRFLTHEQVRRLAQECAPAHDTLIYFLPYTGLRFGR